MGCGLERQGVWRTPASSLVSAFPRQAWLTEIQEYAQHDVVLMLLGNKVGTPARPLPLAPQGGEPEASSHQDPCVRWILPRSEW